ncbi:hypothetical protein ECC02_012934 [Trypanosoma cruzi]|uniref:Uncharacterized protein n=1 Tax=Trypanosoma cruzi TaxID=5693 RepID=A0A7J6XJ68_TRYCR|nr:hypothetical protein ECC02_012934 [Trypanosoma cruzi]
MSVAKYSHKHQHTNPHSALRDHPQRACVLRLHTTSQRLRYALCACACMFGSADTCRAAVRHKRVRRKQRQREADSTHTVYSYHHTHTQAARSMGALNHKTMKNKQKAEAWDDQRTHSHCSRKAKHTHRGERERGRPLNAIKTKQKQLRCSAHAARQDGSGACRAKESTNGPAWVCMQYIQWAHYVCASWDEVRARVHARGHTQRVGERRVCVRAVHGSLSLTLTRPPPQPQPHTQQEEAKEGRWCGRPRCCRHCRQSSPLYFSWLWLRLVFLSDWMLHFHFVFLLVSLHHQLLDHCSGCRLQCSCKLRYWRHHRLSWMVVAWILHGRQMVHCVDWL